MFSKTKRSGEDSKTHQNRLPPPPPPPPLTGAVPSIISADLTVEGNISSLGEVHIDGAVQGTVAVKSLVLGEKGKIEGRIIAERVRICGSVVGNIEAQEVTLVKTARMLGNVLHQQLAVEMGARLEGLCNHYDDRQELQAEQDETARLDQSESLPVFQIGEE